MNYYEHHIRDYDAATSHLTWDEDLAYSRLIRWYYRKEQPIPADLKEACRQVRAATKIQRDAVQSVLNEFFVLREDGWHNETCDEAINRFKEGEPEREVKKANEENRLRRHRDERARLFKIITDAGEHAHWNTGMETLREIAERIQNATPATAPETLSNKPETPPATAPATPATATQTPDTRHQSPEVNPEVIHTVSESESPLREIPPDSAPVQPCTPAGEACRAIKESGIPTTNPSHPTLLALLKAGADANEFRIAAREAVAKGKADFAYVIGTVRKRREEAAALVLHQGRMPTARGPTASGNTREARISNYAAEAARARGEHENEHGTGRTERDITGESVRIA